MNIANNVLKENLKNVYFIGGTACAGKTTISRMLSKKYGFTLYEQDKQYDRHRAMANEIDQPAMCYPRNNDEEYKRYFLRPVDEYAKWMSDSLHEQSHMVLMDLIKLAEKQVVVADVLFDSEDIKNIVDIDHVVFLTTDESLIRESYFNRPEKRDFYDYVASFDNPEIYLENIFVSLEIGNRNIRERIEKSDYFSIKREKSSTIEKTLNLAERHFGFIK